MYSASNNTKLSPLMSEHAMLCQVEMFPIY